MYVYIYDTFVNEPRWQNSLARIETRLTDLGIAGKISRLSVLTSLKELISEAIKKGAETIVAVGNDETVNKLVPLVAEQKVSLGIIPLGKPNYLAQLLGIPEGEKACDVLSARVIERLDLGKANEYFFLNHLEIPGELNIKLNNQYSVKSLEPNQSITIYNFGNPSFDQQGKRYSDPRDGKLEIVFSGSNSAGLGKIFKKPSNRESVFSITTAQLNGLAEEQSVIADNYTVINTPVKVGVAKNRLKVIVGRNRNF